MHIMAPFRQILYHYNRRSWGRTEYTDLDLVLSSISETMMWMYEKPLKWTEGYIPSLLNTRLKFFFIFIAQIYIRRSFPRSRGPSSSTKLKEDPQGNCNFGIPQILINNIHGYTRSSTAADHEDMKKPPGLKIKIKHVWSRWPSAAAMAFFFFF